MPVHAWLDRAVHPTACWSNAASVWKSACIFRDNEPLGGPCTSCYANILPVRQLQPFSAPNDGWLSTSHLNPAPFLAPIVRTPPPPPPPPPSCANKQYTKANLVYILHTYRCLMVPAICTNQHCKLSHKLPMIMQGVIGPQAQAAAAAHTGRREQKGSRGAALSLTEGLAHLVDRFTPTAQPAVCELVPRP